MPIQNFHEDFLGHKIEACNVQQGGLYILRFNVDCHKWEFVPYGAVVGGVDIMDEGALVAPVATCINFIGDYVQAQLVGGCVNVTISQPSCYPAPLSFDPLTSILYTNQGNACESSITISTLLTNATIIADITNPANRTLGVYTGPIDPTTCLGQWYYDSVTGTHYQFNGTIWYQVDTTPMMMGGGTSLRTAITGTRDSNTTITVATDLTAIFKKGMIVRRQESGVDKVGMVSIPSTYSSPNTTITIIGDTCASIDSGTFKYSSIIGAEQFIKNFAIAGTIGATGTDVANAYYATEPMRVIGIDLQVGTAGTTNSTTIDCNKGGTTMFTTKPTLATTVASSPTPFTANTATSLALGDKVTIDIDAVQTTAAIDLYIQLYLLPTRYLSLS